MKKTMMSKRDRETKVERKRGRKWESEREREQCIASDALKPQLDILCVAFLRQKTLL